MYFRLNKNFISFSFKRLTDHLLISATHIAVRGIVEIDPEVKGSKQHGGIAAVHHPHTHGGHLQSCLAEGSVFKDVVSFLPWLMGDHSKDGFPPLPKKPKTYSS